MHPYLLTRDAIESMDGESKTHMLNDNARRLNKSLGDATGLTALGFHLIEVEPGRETTEFHRHHYEDECVYILEGEAEARIGDDTFPVKAGDFIGYPAGGEAHSLTNTGDTPLKCLVAGQRLTHDVSDYPDQQLRLYRNKGLGWDLVKLDQVIDPKTGQPVKSK